MAALQRVSRHGTAECVDDNTAVEFIDGLLSPDEVKQVERHVARCDSCRRLLAELGRSPSIAENSPTLPAGQDAHISLETGQQVGRFVVINRIGAGGMGVVFAAYDPKLDRKVALKLLHSRENSGISAEHAQMRLLREAQAIAQMSHENVVTVYDYGTFKSEVYIAMEFVEGETLTRWLRRWDRNWRDIRDKFLQAGRALAHAHAGSLVHRDFKPDNVLVGNDERVRVMDFGLARSLFADPTADTLERPPAPTSGPAGKAPRALDHALTKTGTVLGTPRYMAPEQFSGVVADARSDQFSFCVALYESVYKKHPFKDTTAERMVEAPDSVQVLTPPSSSPVPSWLYRALVRGLSADPAQRFPSMDALLRAIAPRPRPQPRLRLFAPIVVALLAVVAAVYFYMDRRDLGTHLESAQELIKRLEEQAQELDAQVARLQRQLGEARARLADPASTPGMVAQLREELAGARKDLLVTLQALEETERDLARYTGGKPGQIVARNGQPGGRDPRDPSGEPSGEPADGSRRDRDIPPAQILVELRAHSREFQDCVSEWRERSSDNPRLYAARLVIGADGVPRPGIVFAGIDDRVVHECITGALEDLRFRATHRPTVVRIGFRPLPSGLQFEVQATEKDEDPEPDAPDSAPGDARGDASGNARDRPAAAPEPALQSKRLERNARNPGKTRRKPRRGDGSANSPTGGSSGSPGRGE